jgi:hypothetical protein
MPAVPKQIPRKGMDYSKLAFPKQGPKKRDKRKRKAAEAKVVHAVREMVVERDQGCRACQNMGRHPNGAGRIHMHEIVYRSATRGRPIEDRVSTANCVLLCEHHHADIHAKRLEVEPKNTPAGADGELVFRVR